MSVLSVSNDHDLRASSGLTSRPEQHPIVPLSLFCLISSLTMGGAEMMLYRLLSRLNPMKFRVQVVSMIGLHLGPLSEKFQSSGITLRSLDMRPGIPNPSAVFRLTRWLRADPPDVISTWMYHADLLGGLAAKLAGGIPVAWGIRHCDLSQEGNRWLTLKTAKACAMTSRWLPKTIICNSYASRKAHAEIGYADEKMVVIPNGSDLSAFHPDATARTSVKNELAIPPSASIVGLVGRYHPHKDQENFIVAAGLLHRQCPNVYFVLCGDDITWENTKLAACIDNAGIRPWCRLLGRRHDIARLTAAFDIAVSSSFGESFSTTVAEAMSCEVPCVVTDVGDSAMIVGNTGRVVPPKNSTALFGALKDMFDAGPNTRRQLGLAARKRMKEHFDLPVIVERFEALFEELAAVRRN